MWMWMLNDGRWVEMKENDNNDNNDNDNEWRWRMMEENDYK